MRWLRSIDVTASTSTTEIWLDAARRGSAVGLLFGVLTGLGAGPGQGLVAGLCFGLFMAVFFAWDLERHRRRARREPDGRSHHRPRPLYMPSSWHVRYADHWSMRTPLRAMIYWSIPGTLAAVALFWRIVSPATFASPGEDPDASILIGAPILLGVCWVFGLRAWREYRSGPKP